MCPVAENGRSVMHDTENDKMPNNIERLLEEKRNERYFGKDQTDITDPARRP